MSREGTQFVGVDWSGAGPAVAQGRAIWTAVVRQGVLCDLSNGRTRLEATEHLIALGEGAPRTIAGLDFAFALPRWWMQEQNHDSAPELWAWAAKRMETNPDGWLKQLPIPFWGTNFRLKPTDAFGAARAEFRRTELQSMAPGAIPMSTFQLFGPGVVGAQGLRGQPCLLTLREAGFSIWPFAPPGDRLVVEVFPRLLVRRLAPALQAVRGDALRTAFIDAAPTGLAGDGNLYADLLRANQDAFDAAVSAWALWFGREGLDAQVSEESDGIDRLEGRIWSLPAGGPSPLTATEATAHAPISQSIEIDRREELLAVGIPQSGSVGVAPFAVGASRPQAAERAIDALHKLPE